MSGKINHHDFKEIYSAVARMDVATVDQIANATKYPKAVLKHKLSFYVKTGRLFRVSKGLYSVTPREMPVGYKAERSRVKNARESAALIANCFYNMVRA